MLNTKGKCVFLFLCILAVFALPVAVYAQEAGGYTENSVGVPLKDNTFSDTDRRLLYDVSTVRLYLLTGRMADARNMMRNMVTSLGRLSDGGQYRDVSLAMFSFEGSDRFLRYYFFDSKEVDYFRSLRLGQYGQLRDAQWTTQTVSLDMDYPFMADKVEQALTALRKHRYEVADGFLADIYDRIIKDTAEP